jgi:signal transduction histidine kinase
MHEFLKNAFSFIRQNPDILYSVVLIVLLPLVLYVNTFLTVQSFKTAIDDSIETQSWTIKDTLAALLARDFPDKNSLNRQILQSTIDAIAKDNQGLENIRVIIKDSDGYKAVAAQNRENIDKVINTDLSLNGELTVVTSWASAADMTAAVAENGMNYWRVVKPLADPETKEVYALVAADIPLKKINNSIISAVWQAYAVLALVILITMFLIFQHTRLFSYVGLSKDLQQKNAAKDNFIRMATHELRAPVTVLTAYIESFKEDLSGALNPDQQKYADRMAMSVKNLSDLMADILEVSHLEQGRTDFSPEIVAPEAVVKEIVDGLAPKAEEKGLKLIFDAPQNFSHKISANAVCFKRIITNLVENSIKYTPAGKVTVSVAAQTAKKRCVITIQDTGFGISAEGQRDLFSQFYRVKTQENSGIPGTGLGLWMSREMARKMGGDIMLESIERMGSRFFVYLPLAAK